MGFEEKYELNIPDEESQKLVYVRDIVKYMVINVPEFQILAKYNGGILKSAS